jgi:hypothetical protein
MLVNSRPRDMPAANVIAMSFFLLSSLMSIMTTERKPYFNHHFRVWNCDRHQQCECFARVRGQNYLRHSAGMT